jgi:hypothetical protein
MDVLSSVTPADRELLRLFNRLPAPVQLLVWDFVDFEARSVRENERKQTDALPNTRKGNENAKTSRYGCTDT